MVTLYRFYVVLFLIATNFVWAQVPEKMSYQAVVRDSTEALIKNTPVKIQISILQKGQVLYAETQNPSTNNRGVLSLEIGTGISNNDFSSIDWSLDDILIKTEIDTDGNGYTIVGTTELLSVPFALYAKKAKNGLQDGTTKGDMQYWDGTSWQLLAPGNEGQYLQINNMNIPTWSGLSYPSIRTEPVSAIGIRTATVGGTILNEGGATITETGVCWSLLPNPTIANSKTIEVTTGDTFVSTLTGLTGSTTYYVRAYATNSVGTQYGDEFSFTTSAFGAASQVGDFRHGGVVFWVDPADNTHGLVCAIKDLPNSQWGCMAEQIANADDLAIGSGQQNTLDILAGCSDPDTAAARTSQLELNGFSDWFLPSKDELFEMYTRKDLINSVGSVYGGSPFQLNYYYASSTQYNSDPWEFIYCLNFYGGSWADEEKGQSFYVRAIRAF